MEIKSECSNNSRIIFVNTTSEILSLCVATNNICGISPEITLQYVKIELTQCCRNTETIYISI
jgi:hypothetical protein